LFMTSFPSLSLESEGLDDCFLPLLDFSFVAFGDLISETKKRYRELIYFFKFEIHYLDLLCLYLLYLLWLSYSFSFRLDEGFLAESSV
jgi:hypothetical protein